MSGLWVSGHITRVVASIPRPLSPAFGREHLNGGVYAREHLIIRVLVSRKIQFRRSTITMRWGVNMSASSNVRVMRRNDYPCWGLQVLLDRDAQVIDRSDGGWVNGGRNKPHKVIHHTSPPINLRPDVCSCNRGNKPGRCKNILGVLSR